MPQFICDRTFGNLLNNSNGPAVRIRPYIMVEEALCQQVSNVHANRRAPLLRASALSARLGLPAISAQGECLSTCFRET